MTIDMGLILQFCLILMVIALTVAVIMFILILLDVIQITRRVKKEIKAVTFLIDILDYLVSGFHLARKKFSKSKVGKIFKMSKEDE
ncbi:MAG: hypothetical protein WC624_04560 [Candidatus Margulisiibacteriota bacterium]